MSPDAPLAFLLDALGTLLELEPPATRLQAELAARFGARVSLAAARRAMAAEIAFYRSHLDEGRDIAGLAALRARCAEVIRGELGDVRAIRHAERTELTAALIASLQFRPFGDVRSALERARRHGIRLVVVSNWDASLHEVLARLDLAPLLDGVVTSAQAGARKPAPEIFALALRLAGTVAQRAIHVGDSHQEDVLGARAAGVRPVLLRRDGRPGPPGVRTIRSLSELDS